MTTLGVGILGSDIGAQVIAFETLIGRAVDATRHYQHANEPCVDKDVLASVAAGKTPLIAREPFTTTTALRWLDIAAGKYDGLFAEDAADLLSLGSAPVRYIFHHEPEDDVDAIAAQGKCGIGPGEFVKAWEHVYDFLRARGVGANVQIGVCLMSATFRGGHGGPDVWIPTSMSPDFIATDGYARAPNSQQRWKGFVDTFGAAHDFASARGKPFVIEEAGAAEVKTAPLLKPAWFDEAARTLAVWQPELFMYSNVHASNFNGQDYRVDTSAASLDAFKRLASGL